MNRTLAIPLAALALAACSPDFDPASQVDRLRVLAVKAEPPEVDPSGVATLESLVVRADLDPDPARTTTVVHLFCVPVPVAVPGSDTPTPCVLLANLRDPAAAIAAGARDACAAAASPGHGAPPWPPIDLAGIEECVAGRCGPATVGGAPLPPPQLAVTTAVADAFAALPAGAPDRILGVQAVVLSFALEATAEELVQGVGAACPAGDLADNLARLWPAREHVLATKRVAIRGPEAVDPPNANPRIAGVAPFDPGGASTVAGGKVLLAPVLFPEADAPHETYTKLDADGVPVETAVEAWVYSWFSTAGDLEELHTRDGEVEPWNVVGAPGGVPTLLVAVVRDLRGGVGWQVRTVRVTP